MIESTWANQADGQSTALPAPVLDEADLDELISLDSDGLAPLPDFLVDEPMEDDTKVDTSFELRPLPTDFDPEAENGSVDDPLLGEVVFSKATTPEEEEVLEERSEDPTAHAHHSADDLLPVPAGPPNGGGVNVQEEGEDVPMDVVEEEDGEEEVGEREAPDPFLRGILETLQRSEEDGTKGNEDTAFSSPLTPLPELPAFLPDSPDIPPAALPPPTTTDQPRPPVSQSQQGESSTAGARRMSQGMTSNGASIVKSVKRSRSKKEKPELEAGDDGETSKPVSGDEDESSGTKTKKKVKGPDGKPVRTSRKSRKRLDKLLGITHEGIVKPAEKTTSRMFASISSALAQAYLCAGSKALTDAKIKEMLLGKTRELQMGPCLRPRYAQWGKCTQCVAKLGGDSCRFRGYRTFEIDPVTTEITGPPVFLPTELDGEMTAFPTAFNRRLSEEHIQRIERTVAPHLLPLITRELKHVYNRKALKRGVDAAQSRSLCDFCSSTLFGGFWFCKRCGRDFCLQCEHYFCDSREKMLESPWHIMEAARPRLLKCTGLINRGAAAQFHVREDLQPVSRFTAEELKEHWLALASFVLEDLEGEQGLTALGLDEEDEGLKRLVRDFVEAREVKREKEGKKGKKVDEAVEVVGKAREVASSDVATDAQEKVQLVAEVQDDGKDEGGVERKGSEEEDTRPGLGGSTDTEMPNTRVSSSEELVDNSEEKINNSKDGVQSANGATEILGDIEGIPKEGVESSKKDEERSRNAMDSLGTIIETTNGHEAGSGNIDVEGDGKVAESLPDIEMETAKEPDGGGERGDDGGANLGDLKSNGNEDVPNQSQNGTSTAMTKEDIDDLYTKTTNKRAVPIADPAQLEEHSMPFMFIPSDNLSNENFDVMWNRGEPIIVDDLAKRFKLDWTPEMMIERFGQETCYVMDCQTSDTKISLIEQFFGQFLETEARGKAVLKVVDWPATHDFQSAYPEVYNDFCDSLPVPDYTRRDGVLNLYSHFPPGETRPDIGPKMYNAFEAIENTGGFGTTRLHMDIADAFNVMLYASPCLDGQPGCAVWDLFRAEDADTIRKFLKSKFDGGPLKFTDPIHSQLFYLDAALRKELWERHSVASWRVYQYPGQGVFIPAGCAHQVCNLADCIKIALDFVSPNNVHRCLQLTKDFHNENIVKAWKEDVLQLYNVLWYAWLSSRATRTRRIQMVKDAEAQAVARAAHLASLQNGVVPQQSRTGSPSTQSYARGRNGFEMESSERSTMGEPRGRTGFEVESSERSTIEDSHVRNGFRLNESTVLETSTSAEVISASHPGSPVLSPVMNGSEEAGRKQVDGAENDSPKDTLVLRLLEAAMAKKDKPPPKLKAEEVEKPPLPPPPPKQPDRMHIKASTMIRMGALPLDMVVNAARAAMGEGGDADEDDQA
ncbi:hypothetical protein P7C73_g5636, partial [Tremellales sp. Uapishka_1]